MSDTNIQGAVRDLSMIRRIMAEVAAGGSKLRLGVSASDAAITIHAVALVFAIAFFIQDLGYSLVSGPAIGATKILALSAHNAFLRLFLIGAAATLLLSLTAGLYIVIWLSARKEGEDLSSYAVRNFSSFSALSFLSDLSIKFSAIAAIIAAQRPEWVSPLLLLFTADYLIQGRFFFLPFRLSLALATLSGIIGAAQLCLSNTSLSIALGSFLAITVISMSYLIRRKRAARQEMISGEYHNNEQ